jgi:gliding motility associated protien GldN
MQTALKGILPLLALVFSLSIAFGQSIGTVNIGDNNGKKIGEDGKERREPPLDDIVQKQTMVNRRVIPYAGLREADVFWQKKVWQLIDVREKMNLPFAYDKRPLFQILLEAATPTEEQASAGADSMRIFSDEDFTREVSGSDLDGLLFTTDTVSVIDPTNPNAPPTVEVVRTPLNPRIVKQFRIKEVWYFDKQSASMKTRILGIAPVMPLFVNGKEVPGEVVVPFWVYYPDARPYLAKERVFNDLNDNAPMSWEDVMEMRFFSSYVYKTTNVKDERLQDKFPNSRRDLLMEAQKIKTEIFNFEHDLWTY